MPLLSPPTFLTYLVSADTSAVRHTSPHALSECNVCICAHLPGPRVCPACGRAAAQRRMVLPAAGQRKRGRAAEACDIPGGRAGCAAQEVSGFSSRSFLQGGKWRMGDIEHLFGLKGKQAAQELS